eukprot:1444873-Pyramimonas_sp.AAC.1
MNTSSASNFQTCRQGETGVSPEPSSQLMILKLPTYDNGTNAALRPSAAHIGWMAAPFNTELSRVFLTRSATVPQAL